MSSFDVNVPKSLGLFNLGATFARDAMDASSKDDPIDKMQSFKSTAAEGAGFLGGLLKGGKMLTKSMPFLGNAISFYGAKTNFEAILAEKAKPVPDQGVINQNARELFVNTADLITPIGSPGTYVDVMYSATKYTVENREMLFQITPEAQQLRFESQVFFD